jgi:drug/metabolite transporter (DMT)-like permease
MAASQWPGIIFGLSSALSWGTGDFTGGIATKRSNAYTVVIVSQAIGLVLLAGLVLFLGEPVPSANDLLWGGGAGIAGTIGLVALYRGLAGGRMGVVAPVAALVTAALPLGWGLLVEGLPAVRQIAGFWLAFVAVWFISHSADGMVTRVRDLALPIVAGLGFGLFLILIDRVSNAAVLWPLSAARVASVGLLLVVMVLMRPVEVPASSQLPLIVLAGIFDTGGNAFYALAARAGRLDIAAMLSSLYPAVTVLLARLVLKESISRRQWVGVVSALMAVVLIAS